MQGQAFHGAPPCWNLVTPGISTEQDVLSRLSSLSEVRRDTILDNVVDSQRSNIFWEFTRAVPDSVGRIHFNGDRVSRISIRTIGSLAFGEAVEML